LLILFDVLDPADEDGALFTTSVLLTTADVDPEFVLLEFEKEPFVVV
jgi:hypothetical protein